MNDAVDQALLDAQEEKPDKANIETVGKLVSEQIALEDRIKKGEDLLKTLKGEYAILSEKTLPDAMLEAEVSRFDTVDGDVVKLDKAYYASVKKEDEPAFHKWLEEQEHDAMLDVTVVFKMGKGQYGEAKEFLELLNTGPISNQLPVKPEVTATIHWATLRAFAREQTEEGNDLFEGMNVHFTNRAKIKRAK